MPDELHQEPLSISVSHSIDDFVALKKQWNDLLNETRCLSVCLHWDWMNLWWKNFHTRNFELVLLTIRQGSELTGIFPLVNITTGKRRVLYFMGTGEDEKEEITTEYIDLIAKPDHAESICHLVIDFLDNEYTDWDRLELFRFLKNSSIASYLLNEAWLHDIKHLRYLAGYRHFIALDKTYDEYLGKRSRSFKKNLRNYQNRLEKNGTVIFKIAQTHEDVTVFMEKLIDLHLNRFNTLKKISAFESKKFVDFHTELTHILLDKKQLCLGALYLNDKIIAVEYNFCINRTSHAYQGSFDMQFEKLSAGFLSINNMIKTSTQTEKRIYDFMINAKHSYMTSYGGNRAAVLSCCLFKSSKLNKILYSLRLLKIFIKEALRSITDRADN